MVTSDTLYSSPAISFNLLNGGSRNQAAGTTSSLAVEAEDPESEVDELATSSDPEDDADGHWGPRELGDDNELYKAPDPKPREKKSIANPIVGAPKTAKRKGENEGSLECSMSATTFSAASKHLKHLRKT